MGTVKEGQGRTPVERAETRRQSRMRSESCTSHCERYSRAGAVRASFPARWTKAREAPRRTRGAGREARRGSGSGSDRTRSLKVQEHDCGRSLVACIGCSCRLPFSRTPRPSLPNHASFPHPASQPARPAPSPISHAKCRQLEEEAHVDL